MTIVGSGRTYTFIKVQGVEGSQNPERRRTVHLQAGHMGIDRQFADWRVKGTIFPNLSKSRYLKSRSNLSRQIKVESGLLIPVLVRVSGIESWTCQRLLTSGILISRYVKSRCNLNHQIKCWSEGYWCMTQWNCQKPLMASAREFEETPVWSPEEMKSLQALSSE